MSLSLFHRVLRFKIGIQTIKDNLRATIIFSLLFAGMAAMYSSFYPQFKDFMFEMMEDESTAELMQAFTGGSGDFASYIGFLNLELYSIFFVLILGIIIAFIASTIISKEIESKTIDLLMSNPVSRKQIIIERFLGLIPMVLIINFFTMLVVYATTILINETLDIVNLFITHLYAMPYFLSVISIALLISTISNEKMKSSIFMIALIVGMFFLEYISNITPDTKNIGIVSLTHFYKPYNALKFGEVDVNGVIVLMSVSIIALVASIIYFDWKDIKV